MVLISLTLSIIAYTKAIIAIGTEDEDEGEQEEKPIDDSQRYDHTYFPSLLFIPL